MSESLVSEVDPIRADMDRITAAMADVEQRPDGSVLLGPAAVARIHELIAVAYTVRDENERARAYGRLMGGVELLIGPPPVGRAR